MNVCVIGTGGREHTLAWRLNMSPSVDIVYAIPGSAAMTDVATVVDMKWEDTDALVTFLRDHDVKLVVVGPEAPLVAGLSDTLVAAGFPVFGPSKVAAQLEGSKVFAKDMMKKYDIPTAAYGVYSNPVQAKKFIAETGAPIVIKADGLAAGKGVVVAMTLDEANAAVDDMLEGNRFGDAGSTVVIEEFMVGEEASLLAFADGKTVVPMIASQDHKRIFDNDEGPNTGGMGTYAPAPVLTEKLRDQAMETILKPMMAAMAAEGMPYVGCLYAGLMITDQGCRVVEFNARFGDPETQVVLPLLDGDLGEIMLACAQGKLEASMVNWKNSYATCVIMASKGYPETSSKNDVINGDLSTTDNSMIFHSGTKLDGDHFVTNGGRVLGVVGLGESLQEALDVSYARVNGITFDGMQFRKDIGQKAFKHLK
ncbi:phosphoribosylamine--glycine ligase [Veillonella sp. YH-vei2232]|uniref:Phosphoribosylamine--glycine ligase n=1 Tax=Veillonella absiana TaxID=3079305 RepID=A0ABU3Z609_9FIRM|nr:MULTISPECIES: phosphoribosylamine--glycine ligase [unclassified Veillonella]MDV5063389.1 phosphoribosylamine--glycine ligase [Veillonella sp. YH-vei2232]MDV5087343.1 phosphoribosylamine--glycine ligase [Veillonella sp. YH-vei2233]